MAAVFGAMSLQSCLHDDTELFDEPAANRIENAVSKDMQVLQSAKNGWVLRYVAGQEYSGAGYTLIMKFGTNGKATVSSDDGDPDKSATSSYTIDRSQGPVLSFNDYNEVLDKFAEVSINNVNGIEGDYEFVIQKASPDSVVLKGKKWGNKMVMTPLADNETAKSYLEKVENIKDNMLCSYSILNGADTVGTVTFDPDSKRADVSCTNGYKKEQPFFFTPDGAALLDTVTVAGQPLRNFTWSNDQQTVSSDAKGLTFTFLKPDGYTEIQDWVGVWKMSYWDQTFKKHSINFTVTKKSNSALNATFLNGGAELTMEWTYSKARGSVSIFSQQMEDPTGQYDHLYLLFTDGKYVTWAPKVGMVFTPTRKNIWQLADNGAWGSSKCEGWVIANCNAGSLPSCLTGTYAQVFLPFFGINSWTKIK